MAESNSSLRLVLFGPPGAGKGTQGQLLKDQLSIPQITSGDLFRFHLRNETELGKRAGEFMRQGLLVPDEVTIDIVMDKVLELPSEQGFMLDGFPRTLNQAGALDAALSERSRGLDSVVFINVPDEELIRRLSGRYTCRECQAPHGASEDGKAPEKCSICGGELYQREDDRAEAIAKRLEVYKEETLPLLGFYKQRGILADIPGLGSVEEVNERVLETLGAGRD